MASSQKINDKTLNKENYSDIELMRRELELKYNILAAVTKRKISVRQNLLLLNKKNKNISQSLMQIKKECDTLKSDLHRALTCIKVTSDKQKILSRKKLDEFREKRKNIEQQYGKSPVLKELEDLVTTNSILCEQCNKITALIELTKKQYDNIMVELETNFRKKVCEFCDIVLRLEILKN